MNLRAAIAILLLGGTMAVAASALVLAAGVAGQVWFGKLELGFGLGLVAVALLLILPEIVRRMWP